MAAGLTRQLLDHGIRVPEDIIITGFDNVQNLHLEELTMTTVEQDFTGMARAAIRELDRQIRTGDSRKTRENNISIGIPGQLVLSESCGCGKRDSSFYSEINHGNANQIDLLNHREVSMTYLTIEMSGCDDLKQFHQVLIDKKADTPGLQDLYICLYQNGRDETGEPIFTKEMTDSVCLVHVMKDKQDCGMPMVSFERKYLLPPLAEREDPQVLYLMTLHQNEFAYGYAVFHYYPDVIPSNFFQHFNVILSGALSNIHKRNEILALYEERRLSSITDVMTHLLNRRGLEEQIAPVWPRLCARREYAAFVCFDLDRLKRINDSYGHQAGDYAIRLVAEAIRRSAPKDALSTRMGGDEFLSVIPKADEQDAEKFMQDFMDQLDELNRLENRSFRVEASCGAVVFRLSEFSSLEECIQKSDERMYRQKEERHAQRAE
jgi:diguanylate cyclase (GGDEF)-like protein